MAASSSGWDEAVAYWSRAGELGMEVALREVGCSEQTIVETLSLVNREKVFNLATLKRLTDPELLRAVVLATLARDRSRIQGIEAYYMERTMSPSEVAAFCANVGSNCNISSVRLNGHDFFGTVEGCTLLGNALATNSTLRYLSVNEVGMGGDAVRCLLRGLQSNKRIWSVTLSGNPLLDEGISHVAEFLLKNRKIRYLNLQRTGGSREGAKKMYLALVTNTTLRDLLLGVNSVGREGMEKLLEPLSVGVGEDAMDSSSPKNTSMKSLGLSQINRESVDSVCHMIRTNKSLTSLGLRFSSALPTDWTQKIFPALKENRTIVHLNLYSSDGLVGEEVYESLMDILQSCNTGLENVNVRKTGLDSRQGQIYEELRINKEYRSRLKGQPQRTTTSGRVVLCGDRFAGKTEIANTMKRIEQGTSYGHSLKMVSKKLMQSSPALQLQRSLLGRDAHKELTARTRGFQVVVLPKQPYLKSIWDFAGQKGYHALHDYIFPDVKNSYFLYVCSCRYPPDDSNLKGRVQNERSIRDDCEYWLRFLASNSKKGHRRHESQLPRVRFVLTKTDTLHSPTQVISNAEHVVRDLKGVFKDVVNLCEDIEIVNSHSSTDVQRLLTASSNNLEEILGHEKEYSVCDDVRKFLEGWSQSNLLKPVLGLDDFYKLSQKQLNIDQLSEDGWRIVLAYLNDLGEIIFSKNTEFIVTNLSWFGSNVLGSLKNAFKGADQCQTEVSASTNAFCGRMKSFHELDHCHGFVERRDMEAHLEHLIQSTDLGHRIPAYKLIELMIHLEMCFQNCSESAAELDSLLFIPALFDDEDETAAKGQRQLNWTVLETGPFQYFGRRLECENRITTFLTPGFFPRLQVHLRNYIHRKGWMKSLGFDVARNLIFFAKSGIEVCIEYAGYFDDFIDILVRSSQPYERAVAFIEKNVVQTIRTFCASPHGCQGVGLLESVIRPVCVRDLHLCIERKAHAVLVSDLKDALAQDEAYDHVWSQRIEGVSDSDRALDLLAWEGSCDRISS